MIIVRVIGGLGNQMFQYALYRSLSEKYDEVYIDISDFNNIRGHNGYELSTVFNIKPLIATKKQISKYKYKNNILSKLSKKILGEKKNYYTMDKLLYYPKVFELNNSYLDGYWQSEKYFKQIENLLRHDFEFNKELDEKNKIIKEKIENVNSVSIHIRRGDYLSDKNKKIYGDIATLEYYEKAISYIYENVENPYFFIFSNDIEWCKENFNIKNIEFIDWNKGIDSYKDMQLMSYCKHNIIANSSFSWWGAWLNNNRDKIVVCPNKWINDNESLIEDIIPKTWTIMNKNS